MWSIALGFVAASGTALLLGAIFGSICAGIRIATEKHDEKMQNKNNQATENKAETEKLINENPQQKTAEKQVVKTKKEEVKKEVAKQKEEEQVMTMKK